LARNITRQNEDAFGRVQELDQSQGALPAAVEKELIGILRVVNPEGSAADLASAEKLFRDASEFAPESAAARNLDAIIRIALGYRNEANQIAQELLAAVGLDPQNDTLLANF
jgi:hypothetical protein